MKWSEKYASGIEQIDEQHEMIFKMAEDFRAALDEGKGEGVYGGMLDSLDLYVRTHFDIVAPRLARGQTQGIEPFHVPAP